MSNEFSFARHEDGDGILKIMESDITKGNIKLLYTRRDNPYDSFKMEGSGSVVGVYKNEGQAVATIAGIPKEVYINGRKVRACYVTNMKKLPTLDTHVNWIEAFIKLYDPLRSDVYFCSVVKENTDVLKMLRKPRKRLPYVVDMDIYRTYVISASAHIKNPCPNLEFRRATTEDSKAVLTFLKNEGSKKNLFRAFSSFEEEKDLKVTDFMLLLKDKEILALGALWDRRDCKQYVVKEYSGAVGFFRHFNPLISALGYVTIPKEDTLLKFTFLSFFLAKDDCEDYYRAFLSNVRSEVQKTHDMFVLGAASCNPKRAVLDHIRAITFDTQIGEILMNDFRESPEIKFDYTNLEVECALL